MPFPSAACQTCKTRRIKCDETKPICQRCVKSRRICFHTDTAKKASFSIHIENRYASGKRKRPRGPRSSLAPVQPYFDLQTRALAYYLQNHTQTFPDVLNIGGGLAGCLSTWTSRNPHYPMVDLAISSISLVIFSRTQKHSAAATEASETYSRLLRISQDQVAQLETSALDERNIEACLLAIHLMGRFEGATTHAGHGGSENSFKSLRSWAHHDGAMAVLKIWNDKLSHHPATFIVNQTRRGLIKSCLLRNLPLPIWIQDGESFGEHGIELDYDRIVVRMVNLHYACGVLRQSRSSHNAKVEELNAEARDLDEGLLELANQIPSTYSSQRHILTEPGPWPKKHLYSPKVYSFSRPGDAAVWSQYFAARMLINGTRLRILGTSRQNPTAKPPYEQQRLECATTLKAMADSLAATIPFGLERLKIDPSKSPTGRTSITLTTDEEIKPHLANLVVWPLSIASSLEGVDIKQQQWFRSELARIGRISGDGVLEAAETDQWVTL